MFMSLLGEQENRGEGGIWLILPKKWILAMVHTCNFSTWKEEAGQILGLYN